MSAIAYAKPLRVRLLRLAWLNVAVGLTLAVALWLARGGGSSHAPLTDEIVRSLFESFAYGSAFGLLVPYLAERLAALRAPLSWALIVASLLLIAAASTLLVMSTFRALGYMRAEDFWRQTLFQSVGVFFVALLVSLCVFAYETVRDRAQATSLQLRTHELEKERALKLATEARLASLESRLHPHFLFNTLNSISALIAEDPLLADRTVQRLASLLRTSLDACEQSSVALASEIKLVMDYLEIERARFRERLRYSVEVERGLESACVPPLTLQPVVENSVKFAVAPRPAGGTIRISARRDAGGLALETWDDGAGFDAGNVPAGRGLDNLRARLQALYGEAAQVSFGRRGGGTSVVVRLPLEREARDDA